MERQRVYYVAYSYMKLGQQHLGAVDVTVHGALDTTKMQDMQRVLAEKAFVPQSDLIITFFAEIDPKEK
jgi:hypothetical protein